MTDLKIVPFEGGFKYFVNEQEWNLTTVKTKDFRRLIEIDFMVRELGTVIDWIDIAIKSAPAPNDKGEIQVTHEELLYLRSLTTSIVTTYGKFFSGNRGFKYKPKVSEFFSEEEIKSHDKCIKLRNKIIAHIDDTEMFNVDCNLISNPKDKHGLRIIPFHFVATALGSDMLSDFKIMAVKLRTHCEEQYSLSGDVVFNEYLDK